MIKILKPFRELKRIISQFFETEYWYRFRKTPHYYFNDETQKYELSKYDGKARDTITSTWNGDSDILGIMILKVEHMIHNLKKYSMHANFYVNAHHFFEEGASEKDKYIFAKQVLENCEKHPKDYYFCFDRTEFWTDKEWTKVVNKKSLKFNKWAGFKNSWWIGNEEVDKSISDSGIVHYYLYHSEEFDGWGFSTAWGIEKTYDKQIPPETIPEKRKQYYVNFNEPDLGHEEAPQYKTKKTENVTYFPSCYTWTNIQKIVNDKNIKIDVIKSFLTGVQTMDVSDMKVYSKLSPYIKSKATGLRRNLTELLHLRHLLKKLRSMSDTDDKYYNMWGSVKDPDERFKKLEESIDLYRKDRADLYNEVFKLMSDKGDGWWD